MADYMDDLFKKIKSKKGPEAEKEATVLNPEPQKPTAKPGKSVLSTTEKLMEEIQKAEEKQDVKIEKRPLEPKTKPEAFQPQMKKPGVDIPAATPESEAMQGVKLVGKANEEPGKNVDAKTIEEQKEAKVVQEAEQKLAEIKKELPPQEKVTAEKPEDVDESQKSETAKELEKSGKKLIDEYGNCKIYKIANQPLLYYWSPVARPVGAEKTIINTIKEAATRIVSMIPYKIRDQEQKRNVYTQKILEILRDSPELKIPKTRFEFYADAVVREMVGYGIIDFLINDDQLEEIMVIGPKRPVYVFHRKHEMMLTNIEFYSDNEIQDLVNRIARQIGRRVDLSAPLLDARLPDGSRVNATIPPASVQGSTLTIRKFREEPYSIIDLIERGTVDTEVAAFLWLCVEGLRTRPANILISGGTGSGKTTTLNVMASFIPESERVITIEDTAELNLPLKHWIRMEARPPGLEGTGEITLDLLTKNSLRMRPDRIVVGEIRHDEAFSLFTAFNTGHDGSLGTVHANSPQETIVRVTSPPMNVPEMMLSGLNFILVQHRLHDRKMGTIRRVTEIAEVTNVLEGKAKTEAIYIRDAKNDKLIRTKAQSKYLQLLADMTGSSLKQIDAEIVKRATFLKKLIKENKKEMKIVSEEFNKYLMESE